MHSPLRFLLSLLLPLPAIAQSGTWSNAILGGNATWNDTANWSGGAVANGVDAVATFNGDFSANLQLSFSSPVTVGEIRATDTSTTNPDRGLWLNSGTITFAKSSGTPSITITADTSGGNHDIPLRFFGATVQGSQGLVINLEGANYNGLSAGARFSAGSNWSGFSGPVTLQTGRFRVEATNNTLPPNSEFILGAGVWFQIVRGYTGGLGSQSIRGLSGGDATTLAGAENSANDPAAAGTLTLGPSALAGDAYTFSGTLGGDMFGTGTPNTNFSLTKAGPGLQRLNGNSLYIGATTVSGGTLLVNGTHTQGTGAANAGRYLVSAVGTLGGNGTLVLSDVNGGATGLSISGVLSPGDPALNSGLGALTINASASARSALAFETGGALAIRLGAANSASRLSIVGASSNEIFFNNNTVRFTDLLSGSLSAGQYVLVSADSAGAFSGLTLDGSGAITAGLSIGTGLGSYPGSSLRVVGNNIVLELVVPAGPPPGAPASLDVVSGFDQISLSWAAVPGAGSYTIKRSTVAGSGYVDIATGLTSTAYIDTTAMPGVTYHYVIVAVNGNGESAMSPSGSGVATIRAAIGLNIRAFNTYGMPVSDQAGVVRKGWWNNLVGPSLAGQSVTLADFRDHLGNPVAGLSATLTLGSGSTLKLGSDAVTVSPAANDLNLYSSVLDQYDGAASTLAVSGIPYASYDFVVYVQDGGAARGGLITVNGSTLSVRGGVGNPTAEGSGYVRSTDATNIPGSSVQQGNYVRFSGLSGPLSAAFVAANLGDSTQRLKIAGFQILSNDPNPAPSSVPAAPAGLTASAGNRQVALNWSHAAGASSYRIYRGSTLLATVAAPLTAYADTSAVNGTAYAYTVAAVNAVGESAPSAVASATPAAPAFTPEAQAIYQYSVPVGAIFSTRAADPMRRAYLWVPPTATRLRGVVFGLHNMLEKPLFEDPAFRQACAESGLGIVLITPGDARVWTPNGVGNYTAGAKTTALDLDPESYDTIDINPATGVAFASKSEQAAAEIAEILRRLGAESGYSELQYAPLVMVGHSAASPLIWTRSVHTSSILAPRVVALLPYKGYFPGSVPNGLPILHVASEWQEISSYGNTWELGDASALRPLRAGGAERLLGEFVQPGTGHYQHSETQVGPIAAFVKAVATTRIPADWAPSAIPALAPVAASAGWLVDVASFGTGASAPVAYADWIASGKDPLRAYWYPNQATAQAVCDVMNTGFAKKPQLISAFSNATSLPDLATQSNGEGMIRHTATFESDGVTFRLRAASLNQSPVSRLFHAGPLGIASGSIRFKANRSGALRQTGPDTFRVWLDRGSVLKTGQPWEPFAIAWHPGDANYREADRPVYITTSATVNLTSASGGATQTITFPAIANQSADALASVSLAATSSAGAAYPPQYWVVSGPFRPDAANNAQLVPDTVPAGAKFPLRVVVGAWQWGRPAVFQSAAPVYRTFWIFRDALQKAAFEAAGSPYDADGVPVISNTFTVSSIEALKSVATLPDATITLAPGSYWLTGPATRPSPAPDHPIFLDLAGANTTYVFTGVTLRVDTRELRGYGRVYGHSDTVRVLQVSGANAVVDGLDLRMENVAMNGVDAWGAPREFTADWSTTLVELIGSGVTVKNCTFTTGGSFPYGYGDAFGKGGRPSDAGGNTNAAWIDHRKQSGVRIGRAASGVTLDNVTLHMRSYGHGIFMQEGASDITIKNSAVLGDTLADSDTVIAHPVYQQWGFATYREKIPADIRLSKHEDAIRVYINDSFATNGWPQYINNLTVENTRIERMRDAVAAGDMTGYVRVTGVEAYGCEQGFTPSSLAAENTFSACKGDAVNGPLVFFRRSASNAVVSVELAGASAPVGSWPVALIAGNNNTVTLTRSAPAGVYPSNAYINVAQSWREWRHAPAADIDAAVSGSEAAASSGNTINNQTGLPLVFGRNATNNTAVSNGGVINKGSGNTYVGTTLVPASITVSDTWGSYQVFSGLHSATNSTSLGGANTDAGTLVSAGGTLQIASGLALQGEPLALAGTLASAGATGNTTRFNSTGTAPITLSGDAVMTVTSAPNQFLVGPVSGAGNLSKTGPGILVMEGNANTFSGSFTISAGAVTARANKVVGDLFIAADATLNGNASLTVNQPASALAAINGTFAVNSRGSTDTNAHSAVLGRLTGSGRITSTNAVLGSLTIAGEGDFSGGIDGALGLVKAGATTTLRLSGNLTYSGATAVNAGALDIAGPLPSSTALSLASGAKLIRGVTLGAAQVASFSSAAGATLRPGGLPVDFDPRRSYVWPLISAPSITGPTPDLDASALPPITGSFSLVATATSIGLRHTPTPYAAWQFTRGIPAASPVTADFDGNGRPDLLDYSFSSESSASAANPVLTVSDGGSILTLAFFRGRADLVYIVEASNDLQAWVATATDPGLVGQTVTVSEPVAAPRRFFRLKVSPR